jgi:4-hydroxythreonine-4-phosphate dehydrogenase
MKPRLLITMGDPAGIGPEIILKAWPALQAICDPLIVGAAQFVPGLPVHNPSGANLVQIRPGQISAAGGRAAYEWLCYAIDECLAGRADGIVTCPLHKEGLHAAGVPYPGHTEILAARTGAQSHAMLLYDDALPLAVAHVTLHVSVKDALRAISVESIEAAIKLLAEMIPRLTGTPARIGVMALNPHASDGGLFGCEEATIIAPALKKHPSVIGPIPADAAFLPHNLAKYNGLVAMIHDHGHIPMKLLGGRRAVNVTAGLPIVRVSVAHGTAYDIVGQGRADETSLISAATVAARLAMNRAR